MKPPKKIMFPDRGAIYDQAYFPETNEWKNWNTKIDPNETIPASAKASEIIVTTDDKVKFEYMLELYIRN